MNDEQRSPGTDDWDDGVLDRVAAADPAADLDVREGVLRAKVDDLLGATGPGGQAGPAAETAAGTGTGMAAESAADGEDTAPTTSPTAPAPGDELAARRARRPRTSWLVAAAAATVVAVGGASYLAGTESRSGPTAGLAVASFDMAADGFAEAGDAAPPVSLAAPGGSRGEVTTLPEAEVAVGPGDVSGARVMAGGPWGLGRTVFHAQGLSEDAGSAEAFALDPRPVADAATAARVAAALGVPGEVRTQEGGTPSWAVGSQDGSGAQVWVAGDGRGSFGYTDPGRDPWTCAAPAADGSCPTPQPTGVTDDEAAAALADVMRRLGVDPAGYEVQVRPAGEDDPSRWVSARRVVGGTATEDAWSATVTDAGVVAVDGSLADAVPLGEYPVVSPAEAVRRLGDPRFGASTPTTLPGIAELRVGEEQGPTGVPTPPAPGAPLAWPVTDVTITGARLGLSQQWLPDGSVVFLPAYELSDAEGSTWTVTAVADAGLDFSPR
ncbi:hypothetical protein DNL40_15350 [Xylanimonas oleitrophica]|uniref:Uncharacterized protein n=1 Tax=Xylanimonas oleitrophica TaxID=2607479 RepID=A0A2W5WTT2_9MICO|nr:hypothetical protein [Xylanimonas oleitrophica]PZR51646.1 hypothetical protein DNL40_15350 [Xylanimonas oleitrophica]